MFIVDSQVHIWETGSPTGTHSAGPWTGADIIRLMDENGIERAINHPPPWDPDAMRIADEAARSHPHRLSYLGRFAPDRADNRVLVENWRRQPGMLGFRFVFNAPEQRRLLDDGSVDWLWQAAERAGAPVGLAAASALPLLGEIAERHPGLKLHVDHMGVPPGASGDAAFANLPALLSLARHPNVAVKLSATPLFATDGYPFHSVHDAVHRVVNAFGPERCFWGTDITRMPCTWARCVTMFTEHMQWLAPSDLEMIMGRSIMRWLNWQD